MPKKDGVDLLAVAGRNVMRGFVWGALVAGVASPTLVASRVQAAVKDIHPQTVSAEDQPGTEVIEEDPGEDTGEQEPADCDAPAIEILWGEEPLFDGALMGSSDQLCIAVTEQNPSLDDEGRPTYEATLTHNTTGKVIELPKWRSSDDGLVWKIALGGANSTVRFAEGSYDLEVRCVDASGNTVTEVRHFCLDTREPLVNVKLATGSVLTPFSQGRVYAPEPLALEVEVADLSLDLGETTLLGVPFSDLVGTAFGAGLPQGVTCTSLAQATNTFGIPTYTTTLSLAEGTYDLTGIVCAQDGFGRTSQGGLFLDKEPLSAVVVDGTAPEIRIEGVEEGVFTNKEVALRIHVHEANLGALALIDGKRSLAELTRNGEVVSELSVGYEGATVTDTDHAYEVRVPVLDSHEGDGVYELRAQLEDLCGNTCESVTRSFVVDTVAPELSVTFESEGEGQPSTSPYFRATRTAHLVVHDDTLDAVDLEAAQSLLHVSVTASCGRSSDEVTVGEWHHAGSHELACDLVFPPNGTYEFRVSGMDVAGNALVGREGTEVNAHGTYTSGRFVVDDLAPDVEVSYKKGTTTAAHYGGVDYFRKPTVLVVRVSDRNFDSVQSTVTDTFGKALVPQWHETHREDDGMVSYEAEIPYWEDGGARKSPRVHAIDLAGNKLNVRVHTFVVDQTAPSIQRIRTSRAPAEEMRERPEDDPLYYYNAEDGASPSLIFSLFDECGLARVWLDDPDDVYDLEGQDVLGKTRASFVVRLKDQEGERSDTAFERGIRLRVQDIAGNAREWSLDRTGRVITDRTHTTQNRSLDDGGVFPQALIFDSTSPQVSVTGVEAGTYYDAEQVAHIEVRERLFSHIQRFDAQRVIATIERRDPTPERTPTKWTIRAAELEGDDPLYTLDQPVFADGHYTIAAGFTDIASNSSNTIHIGEFTVDTVAPTIEVTWNNEDVRNGMYYRAARVATVRIVEHNFSPDRVSIQTSGAIGTWRAEGDAHICEVSFTTDSSAKRPHTLVIKAHDLAGNSARDYEAMPFVIDTEAPALRVLKRVSTTDAFAVDGELSPLQDATAYSRAFAPVVQCSDGTSFDAGGVKVSLVGTSGESWEPNLSVRQDGMTLEWPNMGLEQREDAPSYLVEADDVYTLTAKVVDLAGNESDEQVIRFSLNRYGSTFYAEEINRGLGEPDREEGTPLLAQPPRIVIHEINVSGAVPDGQDGEPSHVVTKEHAHATTEIPRTAKAQGSGYVLSTPQQNERTAPEEWSEYVYLIGAGNFGRGSDADLGDGGQGLYRVNVSSRDRAQNLNTTAGYWDTSSGHGVDVRMSRATASFILDEEGPTVDEVVLPEGVYVGDDFRATFSVHDEITNGDTVQVLVDGQKTEVISEESGEPLDEEGHITHQGSFSFVLDSRPLAQSHDVEIRVADYTGLAARTQTVRREGLRVTTLVPEISCAVIALATFVLVRRWVAQKVPPRA